MSDLVVIAFPTEAKAEEVRQKLLQMQKEYLIELGDAVIAVKDAQGHVKLNQLINTTKVGAVGGTFWGALIGLIFLMPLARSVLIPFLMAPTFSSAVEAPCSTISFRLSPKRITS